MSSKKKNIAPEVTPEAVEEPVKVEETKSETMKAPISKPAQKSAGNLMYVGPTIPGILKHATVYKDGKLPAAANNLVAEFGAIKNLLVPLDKASAALKEINKKHSALRTLCDLVTDKYIRR